MKAAVLKKPSAFYDKFERKGGAHQETTHYCPGCGHGNLHKLIAEALTDFNVADRTILISPVGCSVFAYYYLNVGNVQAAHGRAPAVATGLKRANPNSIVISYQGDGDLAAIGTAEILHAANRGENISVFFVNNAIYGMTGSQMAPTTLVGQKTTTTPYGRKVSNEGFPIRMAEIISTLEAPVYVERTALIDFKSISRTKRAVRKVLQNQIENRGFSFLEILSPCPTGWKLSAPDAQQWIRDYMLPVFPTEVFKDTTKDAETLQYSHREYTDGEVLDVLGLSELGERKEVTKEFLDNFPVQNMKIAGFGGQGVLSAGVVIAACGMNENLDVTWIPSYGPEMRGGTANCSVIISNKRIGSPLTTKPNVLIAMNGPSLDAFEDDVVPNGLVIINSSIVERRVKRKDVVTLYIPLTEIASNLGLTAAANMVCLGAYLEFTGIMDYKLLFDVIPKTIKRKNMIETNIKAVEAGVQYVRENAGKN
ncbi:2-oxoacid:acceptor oxidoreductase family protein [candidate division KSB1 bacterium]|nr:2-oxoacid:acceptor oxidoreductase family protein [candidate division KSB1 bacterium]